MDTVPRGSNMRRDKVIIKKLKIKFQDNKNPFQKPLHINCQDNCLYNKCHKNLEARERTAGCGLPF